jgi:hypothetical protein
MDGEMDGYELVEQARSGRYLYESVNPTKIVLASKDSTIAAVIRNVVNLYDLDSSPTEWRKKHFPMSVDVDISAGGKWGAMLMRNDDRQWVNFTSFKSKSPELHDLSRGFEQVSAFAVSPSGRMLAVCDTSIRIYNTVDRRIIKLQNTETFSLAQKAVFNLNETKLAVRFAAGIHVFDLPTGQESEISTVNEVIELFENSDNAAISTSNINPKFDSIVFDDKDQQLLFRNRDNTISVALISTGEIAYTLPEQESEIVYAGFDAASNRLYTLDAQGHLMDRSQPMDTSDRQHSYDAKESVRFVRFISEGLLAMQSPHADGERVRVWGANSDEWNLALSRKIILDSRF